MVSGRPIVRTWFPLILILTCIIAAGCIPDVRSATVVTLEPLPTPTTFTFFREGEKSGEAVTQPIKNVEGVPTVSSLFTQQDTPTPKPAPTRMPTSTPASTSLQLQLLQTELLTATVFDDSLGHNWEIQENDSATVDVASSVRVYRGHRSIAFTPQEDFSALYFTVKQEADTLYPLEEVLGVSFWINGGDDSIQLDQLGLAVIGSNEYSYWVADDDSVEFPEGETFSETRLYWLDLNRSILPETWVQVYLPLDTLIYDPVYENVVGFYLKNDEGFRNTIYLDDVSLIMLDGREAAIQSSSTSVPSLDASLTPQVGSEDAVTSTATAVVEPEDTVIPTATATPESAACVVTPPDGWEIYIVQAGDTYSGLAAQNNIALDFMLSVNCLDVNNPLSIGLEIWLPGQTQPTEAPPDP